MDMDFELGDTVCNKYNYSFKGHIYQYDDFIFIPDVIIKNEKEYTFNNSFCLFAWDYFLQRFSGQ